MFLLDNILKTGSVCQMLIKSVPSDKFLFFSKLKAFGDEKINVTEKLKFVFVRVEIIVGKGENAGNQHFLVFHRFSKPSFSGLLKVGIVCGTLNVPRKTVCSHFPHSAFSYFKRILTFCNFTGTVEWSLFIGEKNESVE